MRLVLLLAVVSAVLPACFSINLPEFDHDLPGWGGEAAAMRDDDDPVRAETDHAVWQLVFSPPMYY